MSRKTKALLRGEDVSGPEFEVHLELIEAAEHKIRPLYKASVDEGIDAIGQVLLHDFFEGDAKRENVRYRKHKSMGKLLSRCFNEGLAIGRTFLFNALYLAIYKGQIDIGGAFHQLDHSHRIELLPMLDAAAIEKLAKESLEKNYSVRRLRKEVEQRRPRKSRRRSLKRCIDTSTNALIDQETGALAFTVEQLRALTPEDFTKAHGRYVVLRGVVEQLGQAFDAVVTPEPLAPIQPAEPDEEDEEAEDEEQDEDEDADGAADDADDAEEEEDEDDAEDEDKLEEKKDDSPPPSRRREEGKPPATTGPRQAECVQSVVEGVALEGVCQCITFGARPASLANIPAKLASRISYFEVDREGGTPSWEGLAKAGFDAKKRTVVVWTEASELPSCEATLPIFRKLATLRRGTQLFVTFKVSRFTPENVLRWAVEGGIRDSRCILAAELHKSCATGPGTGPDEAILMATT